VTVAAAHPSTYNRFLISVTEAHLPDLASSNARSSARRCGPCWHWYHDDRTEPSGLSPLRSTDVSFPAKFVNFMGC